MSGVDDGICNAGECVCVCARAYGEGRPEVRREEEVTARIGGALGV